MTKGKIVEQEANGCRLVLVFPEEPVEGTLERIQDVLFGAYEERIEKELSREAHTGISA